MKNKIFFTLYIGSIFISSINAMEMEEDKNIKSPYGFYLFNNTDCDFYAARESEEKNHNKRFKKTGPFIKTSTQLIKPGKVGFVAPHQYHLNLLYFTDYIDFISKLHDTEKNLQQCYTFGFPPTSSYTLSLVKTTPEIKRQWPRDTDIESITSWERTKDNKTFRLVKHPSTMDNVVKIESSGIIPSLSQLCSSLVKNNSKTIDSSAVALVQNLWLPKDISL